MNCKHCDKELVGKRKGAKYCDIYCLNRHSNENRIFTDSHRKKISEKHKGKRLSEDHKRKISESLKGVNVGKKHSAESKHNMSVARKKLLKNRPDLHPNNLCRGKKSYPQELLFDELTKIFKKVDNEVYYKSYWIDLLVNDILAVEVDGEFWHKGRENSDREKDSVIRTKYSLVRIPAKDVLNDVNKVVKRICGLVV